MTDTPDEIRSIVDVAYGEPFEGVPVIEVGLEHAALLARAHARVHQRPAAVHRGDGVLRDPTTAEPVTGSIGADRWHDPPDEIVEALRQADAPIALIGPGILRSGNLPELHGLAAAADLGVLNTWGAKGIFDFRSRHHLATVGLQAHDLDRSGIAESDLLILAGDDPAERPVIPSVPTVDVDPSWFGLLAEHCPRPAGPITVPPLRADLAAATEAGWAVEEGPLPPSRLTLHLSSLLGGTGLVTADPGIVGYWIARTFGTRRPGGVHVPAEADATGFAVAGALVSRLREPGRPVLAVLDGEDGLDDLDAELLEVSHRLGMPVPVEVWSPDGPAVDADTHHHELPALIRGSGHREIGYDPTQLDRMIDAAGPIVAWRA